MSRHTDRDPTFRKLIRNNEEKIASALRSGGFACFLPKIISSGALAGFPRRLVYVGGLLAADRLRVIVTDYGFDGYSYADNDRYRELLYFNEVVEWFTAVKFDKSTSSWHATKYSGSYEIGDPCRGLMLAYTTASSLEQLLIHATMIGPDPGEPVVGLDDFYGEDIERIFVCPLVRGDGSSASLR
jgi:hypothetical protein